MRIVEFKEITGTITVITGLHIGGNKDDIEIGGMDNPVIKNPVDNEPYIPGSSLKGKLRCLLELAQPLGLDKIIQLQSKLHTHKNGHNAANCPVCRIFGMTTRDLDNYGHEVGPTRLIVRDSFIKSKPDGITLTTEEKYENSIDRLAGKATSPRPLERVVPGVVFNLSMTFRSFDIDKELEDTLGHSLIDYVHEAIKLLHLDALGGCGSRGSGKVELTVN